jgi:histidinol-phosphate aminotransferase
MLQAHQLEQHEHSRLMAIAPADTDHQPIGVINGEKARLVATLRSEGRRVIPSETNFVMIDMGRDVAPVIAAFRDRRILVGRRFRSMPTWLRLSIGTPREMDAFAAALREIVPPPGPGEAPA